MWTRGIAVIMGLVVVLACAGAIVVMARAGWTGYWPAIYSVLLMVVLVFQALLLSQLARAVKELAQPLERIASAIQNSGRGPSTSASTAQRSETGPQRPDPGSSSTSERSQHLGVRPASRPTRPENPDKFDLGVPDPAEARQHLNARLEAEVAGRRPPPQSPRTVGNDEPPTPPTGRGGHRLDPADLVTVWEDYLARGDGHFNQAGLARALRAAGINAEVIPAERLVGLGAGVLGVAGSGSADLVYLLPDFTRAPQSVETWFQLDPTVPRTARVRRLVRPAELERRESRYEIRAMGILE